MLDAFAYLILSFSIINFLLGIIVLLRTKREALNVAFLVFAFTTSIWTFNNFYLRLNPDVLFLKIAYGIGLLVATFAVFWILLFLKNKVPRIYIYVLVPISIIVAGVTIFTDSIIKALYSIETLGYEGELGAFFDIYSGYFSLLIIFIIYQLVHEFRCAQDNVKRTQIVYVLFGVFVFATTALIVSFIIPVFLGSFAYTILDNMSFSVFLVMITYAIFRHRLFNIKVIATEVLTFTLWIFLFGRTLFSIVRVEYLDALANGLLLTLTVLLGTFLIKSVIKEVETREQLAIANKKLERLNMEKSQFLSFASHEVKHPLTNIKNALSLALEGSFGEINEKLKELLQKIFDEAENSVIIIDNYLNISRIEQGRMDYKFDPIDVKKLSQLVVEGLKHKASEKGNSVTLQVPDDPEVTINADYGKIKEVLTNVIDNSIKYTNAGGYTNVSLSKNDTDKKITITVKDNGIGMSKETISKLFRRFSRAVGIGRQAKETEGTGLGMYISREIVLAHGGRIWAESPGEGKGSAFILELPYVPTPQEEHPEDVDKEENNEKHT